MREARCSEPSARCGSGVPTQSARWKPMSVRGTRWLGSCAVPLVAPALAGSMVVSAQDVASAGAAGVVGTVTVNRVSPVAWVAVQDGSGAWQRLEGKSLQVKDARGRYGVA